MNKMKLWDEYEIKARYVPTFLSLIPISQLLILLLGENYWEGLFNSIIKMAVISNVGISLVLMVAMVQVQSSIAKYWIEDSVFGENGERFPTTEMLLYNGGLISFERKEQIRSKITKLTECTLSSESDESNNPNQAKLLAQESVGVVRRIVGKGTMVCRYNIRYGFFRNLIGGVIWSVLGSVGCAIVYGISKNWEVMSMFVVFALIHSVLFLGKKKILTKLAFTYAGTLFNEFLLLKEVD